MTARLVHNKLITSLRVSYIHRHHYVNEKLSVMAFIQFLQPLLLTLHCKELSAHTTVMILLMIHNCI